MKKAILVFLLTVLATLPATAEPGWGGGILAGYQAISYPFFEGFEDWNNDHRLAFCGSYGYGVTEKRFIGGGFGGLIDDAGKAHTGGTAGGFILGKCFIAQPVSVSLVSWPGFGPA